MSETFEEQEQEEWTGDEEGLEASGEGDSEEAAGPRRARDTSYGAMANRNLQRARKSVMAKGDSDDESGQAQFLVQSATVYAILDLADAVRNQGK